jgi:predicted SAM-dependent methyltransferase
MEEAGFEVHALEYWDGDGTFHAEEWSSEDGHVARSKNHDHRNQDGTLRYTSLIVDGLKPSASA